MPFTQHALRKMRIVAIPLTQPFKKVPPNNDTRVLVYYQFQLASKMQLPPSSTKRKDKSWLPAGGVANWITTKAAHTWAGFGKEKGGWKLKVFRAGERLVDRLDFEELALKSVDPSLGPTISHPSGGPVLEEKGKVPGRLTIPLIYPPSITRHHDSLLELRKYVEHRVPTHRKGFWMWLLIAPFTAPFMIIPIIPNLPFFFCAWRSWSHYKAYRSSQYLQSLLDNNIIVPEPSKQLDKIYHQFRASKSNSPSNPPSPLADGTPQHIVLLSQDAIPAILSSFDLKPAAAADLYRAIEQARIRVDKGELGL